MGLTEPDTRSIFLFFRGGVGLFLPSEVTVLTAWGGGRRGVRALVRSRDFELGSAFNLAFDTTTHEGYTSYRFLDGFSSTRPRGWLSRFSQYKLEHFLSLRLHAHTLRFICKRILPTVNGRVFCFSVLFGFYFKG